MQVNTSFTFIIIQNPAPIVIPCNTNRLMLYVCLIKQTNSSDAKNCDEIYSYKLLTFNLDLQITNETSI